MTHCLPRLNAPGWIYDHLLPHAEKLKVVHPLMLRAIASVERNTLKWKIGF
jgi:hypothetical protein